MSEAKRSSWKKWAIGVGTTCLVSVGFMGFLHTSVGKPLLMKLGGCPITIAPQADVERERKEAFQKDRGTEATPTKLALGFSLGGSTLGEVEAWASHNDVSCEKKREDSLLTCKNVPTKAFKESLGQAPVSELMFSFRLQDKKLISVSAWRYGLDGQRASTELGLVADGLKSKLGTPKRDLGGRQPQDLTASAFATTVVDFKFSDYSATVSTTNVPGKGVQLREEYLAID